MKVLFLFLLAIFFSSCSQQEYKLQNQFKHKTKHHGVRTIYEGDNTIFFTAPMSVNTDGAPTSYHPDDPKGNKGLAINSICNGSNALLPNGKVIRYNQCKKLIKAYQQAKKHGWENPKKPRMQFYAIAKNGHTPCTIRSGKFKGYFVSTTALVANKHLKKCDQNRYLNALKQPFIIYPQAKNFIKRDIGKKDIAILYNPTKDILAYAIIGDSGPKWGLSEGSVYLAKKLKGMDRNPNSREDTYHFALSKVHTLILPHTTIEPPYTAQKIEYEAQQAFEKWGGLTRLKHYIEKYGNHP